MHSAAVLGGHMFVFGGLSSRDQRLGDLWRFTFRTRTWEQFRLATPPCTVPSPRWSAVLAADEVNRTLWLQGGSEGRSSRYCTPLSDVWRLPCTPSMRPVRWDRVALEDAKPDGIPNVCCAVGFVANHEVRSAHRVCDGWWWPNL